MNTKEQFGDITVSDFLFWKHLRIGTHQTFRKSQNRYTAATEHSQRNTAAIDNDRDVHLGNFLQKVEKFGGIPRVRFHLSIFSLSKN